MDKGHIFNVGASVRVINTSVSGHARTPNYILDQVGEIHKIHGTYHNPESVAHGGTGLPAKTLYSVSFKQSSIWKEYNGQEIDHLYVDVFEHWLEFA